MEATQNMLVERNHCRHIDNKGKHWLQISCNHNVCGLKCMQLEGINVMNQQLPPLLTNTHTNTHTRERNNHILSELNHTTILPLPRQVNKIIRFVMNTPNMLEIAFVKDASIASTRKWNEENTMGKESDSDQVRLVQLAQLAPARVKSQWQNGSSSSPSI